SLAYLQQQATAAPKIPNPQPFKKQKPIFLSSIPTSLVTQPPTPKQQASVAAPPLEDAPPPQSTSAPSNPSPHPPPAVPAAASANFDATVGSRKSSRRPKMTAKMLELDVGEEEEVSGDSVKIGFDSEEAAVAANGGLGGGGENKDMDAAERGVGKANVAETDREQTNGRGNATNADPNNAPTAHPADPNTAPAKSPNQLPPPPSESGAYVLPRRNRRKTAKAVEATSKDNGFDDAVIEDQKETEEIENYN
ncbi:hypothetical protein TrRE_jg9858, partial [Triparma retinervis]